jgi:hypothetical protein
MRRYRAALLKTCGGSLTRTVRHCTSIRMASRSREPAALICIPSRPRLLTDVARLTRSIVTVGALAPLVALLGLNRQGRNRPSFKALELDRLTGFFAIAVSTVFDSLQRSIDLGDQFALSVTSAQFDGAVGFRRGAIGVSLASLRMSSRQSSNFSWKYSRCRSFMKGSFSLGR